MGLELEVNCTRQGLTGTRTHVVKGKTGRYRERRMFRMEG